MTKRHLVYTTDQGQHCPNCENPKIKCTCQIATRTISDGIIKLQKQVKGRNGKPVTLISGLPIDDAGLNKLAKELKKKCGAGGSIEGRNILIQGDKRKIIKDLLEKMGYQVKLSGG